MPAMKKYLSIIFLASLLAACATTMPLEDAINQPLPWSARVKQLTPLDSWNIRGVVSITAKQHTQTADMTWQLTDQQHFVLSLMGPLGLGRVTLRQTPMQTTLIAHGKESVAQSPEALMQATLGWQVPVSDFYYWVRGLPSPRSSYRVTYDTYHHLATLHQEGWQIIYASYQSVNQIDIPRKIFLTRGDLHLIWVTQSWTD